MGYRNRTFFTRKYLSPLIQKGELRMTQSDKSNSGEKVKAYLRKGAKPIREETEYPNARVVIG